MIYTTDIKERSRTLRRNGVSVRKVSVELRVPVSTIQYWNAPEEGKQVRAFWLGKKRPTFSAETRRKMGEAHKGARSHFWKGGISTKYRMSYGSVEYREWRKAVFERDNYKCQGCDAPRGTYITAHHIKSFAYHPLLRFEVSNGLTLCEPCHMKTDNYKGRANRSKI